MTSIVRYGMLLAALLLASCALPAEPPTCEDLSFSQLGPLLVDQDVSVETVVRQVRDAFRLSDDAVRVLAYNEKSSQEGGVPFLSPGYSLSWRFESAYYHSSVRNSTQDEQSL